MKKSLILSFVMFISFGVFYGFNASPDNGREIDPNPKFKNLQVLPQDISEDDLYGLMNSFNYSLGVKCSFCHTPGDDGKMDWASDEKKHKNVARGMMRMTMDINKNYFNIENPAEFEVDCFTCHNGSKHPALTPPEGFENPDWK